LQINSNLEHTVNPFRDLQQPIRWFSIEELSKQSHFFYSFPSEVPTESLTYKIEPTLHQEQNIPQISSRNPDK